MNRVARLAGANWPVLVFLALLVTLIVLKGPLQTASTSGR